MCASTSLSALASATLGCRSTVICVSRYIVRWRVRVWGAMIHATALILHALSLSGLTGCFHTTVIEGPIEALVQDPNEAHI